MIHDNIIIANEAFQFLKNKKMDMNKGYDRIEWHFFF